MSQKALLILTIFALLAIVLGIIWAGFLPEKAIAPVIDRSLPAKASVSGFAAEKPNFVISGRNLGRVEVWAVPAGAGEDESGYKFLGNAELSSSVGGEETWILPIPAEPVLAAGIKARAFDQNDEQVHEISLPHAGEAQIYNAFWGAPARDANSLAPDDSGLLFSYKQGERFSVSLDDSVYPSDNFSCQPAGIISRVAAEEDEASTAAVFEAASAGQCLLKNNGWSVGIKIYDPEKRWENYIDDEYNIDLEYAAQNIFSEDGQSDSALNTLAQIDLPGNIYLGTNLSQASALIGASRDEEAVRSCLEPKIGEAPAGTAIIGGAEYAIFTALDAAAGNRYENISHRLVRQNTCYEVAYFLHWGEIANYAPGMVREFDRDTILAALGKVLEYLRFTKNN